MNPNDTQPARAQKRPAPAQIEREYGPFPGVDQVHGVTFDGRQVWFASNDGLRRLDPASGIDVSIQPSFGL